MIFSIFWFTILVAATHYATPVRVVDSGSVGGDQNRDKKIKHSALNVVFVRLEANVAPCLCANMKLQQIFKAILL